MHTIILISKSIIKRNKLSSLLKYCYIVIKIFLTTVLHCLVVFKKRGGGWRVY